MLRGMEYSEFKRHIGKAGISIGRFAELIGRHPASVINYGRSGEVPAHLAALAVLMGCMAEAGLDFVAPLERLCLVRGKPRGRAFDSRDGNLRSLDQGVEDGQS